MSDDLDLSRFDRFNLPDFQCDDGWRPLIHDLLTRIDALLGPERAIEVDQIKEKFGSLRFYWRGDVTDAERKQVQKFVDDASRASGRICELCGKPGLIHPWNGGLWQSNCGQHAREAVLQRKKPLNGAGWWLATAKWQIVDPTTGKALSPDRLSAHDSEARATLEAQSNDILLGEEKLTEIFGMRVHIQAAVTAAHEYLAARFVCRVETG